MSKTQTFKNQKGNPNTKPVEVKGLKGKLKSKLNKFKRINLKSKKTWKKVGVISAYTLLVLSLFLVGITIGKYVISGETDYPTYNEAEIYTLDVITGSKEKVNESYDTLILRTDVPATAVDTTQYKIVEYTSEIDNTNIFITTIDAVYEDVDASSTINAGDKITFTHSTELTPIGS